MKKIFWHASALALLLSLSAQAQKAKSFALLPPVAQANQSPIVTPAAAPSKSFSLEGVYDTVYVSTEMTTYLVFPASIKMLDLGSKNYIGKVEENKLLLKPLRAGVPLSAMLVETEDKQVYLHYIAYRQQPKKIFWDYRKGSVLEVVAPSAAAQSQSVASSGSGNTLSSETVLEQHLNTLKKQKKRRVLLEKKNRISLAVNGMAVDKTATYLVVDVKNGSSIPYQVDYVSFAYQEKRPRKSRQKVSAEKMEVLPLLSQSIEMVSPGQESRLAYALPVFANTLKGKLVIVLREASGNRVIQGSIPAKKLASALYLPSVSSSTVSYALPDK